MRGSKEALSTKSNVFLELRPRDRSASLESPTVWEDWLSLRNLKIRDLASKFGA